MGRKGQGVGPMRSLAARLVVCIGLSAILPAEAQPSSFDYDRSLSPTIGLARDTVAVRLVSGSVTRATQTAWQPVERGQLLRANDAVRTADQALLVLELPEQAGFVHVLGGSELRISELRQLPGPEGPQAATFTLNGGKAYVKLRSFNRRRSRFQVQTPSGSAAVRGTAFVIAVDQARTTRIGVTAGRVSIQAQGREVDVTPGQVASIVPGQAPTRPKPHTAIPLRLTSFLPVGSQAHLTGRAAPGSTVMVNGRQVLVADDGSFTAAVPLEAAATRAFVEAIDPTGAVESLTISAGVPLVP